MYVLSLLRFLLIKGHHIYTNVSLIDAYLMDRNPIASYQAQQMTHHFELDDDLKEFWGFYLLKGSKLTVRSCARLYFLPFLSLLLFFIHFFSFLSFVLFLTDIWEPPLLWLRETVL